VTENTQKIPRARSSWFNRFWAVVRYEMLWNIRKKKFIGIVILGFVIASVGLFLPPILSSATGQALTSNPDYVVTYSIPAFGLFLFALATAMNSISSEFESGTIVPLLTKPVSRTMVFLGKLFAAFIIILITYTLFYVYIIIGGTAVYGGQNNLQLVPLGLLGNVITTFIWISIILSVGSLSKNTLISALVAFGLFMALLIAVPIVSTFAGPSVALNCIPGNGASGAINTVQGNVTIGGGPDNIGTNLINYVLYPSANVSFTKMNIELQGTGQQPLITQTLVYTEPISVVALRSLGVALAYIFVFLFIAWYSLKRTQVLE
jgi:ABC-type transport system involved in multi-copper enzyme maturation permease subunit